MQYKPLTLNEPPISSLTQVRGGAQIVHTKRGNKYMLNVGEVKVNHKRILLLGFTQ